MSILTDNPFVKAKTTFSLWPLWLVLALGLLTLGFYAGMKLDALVKDKEILQVQNQLTTLHGEYDLYRVTQNNKLKDLERDSSSAAKAAQDSILQLKGSNSTLWGKYQAALKAKPPIPPGCPPSLSADTVGVIEMFRTSANSKAEGKPNE